MIPQNHPPSSFAAVYLLGVMLLLWHLQWVRIVLASPKIFWLMECKRTASELDHAPSWPAMQCNTGTGDCGSGHMRR